MVDSEEGLVKLIAEVIEAKSSLTYYNTYGTLETAFIRKEYGADFSVFVLDARIQLTDDPRNEGYKYNRLINGMRGRGSGYESRKKTVDNYNRRMLSKFKPGSIIELSIKESVTKSVGDSGGYYGRVLEDLRKLLQPFGKDSTILDLTYVTVNLLQDSDGKIPKIDVTNLGNVDGT